MNIAITCGDCNGIGMEVMLKMLKSTTSYLDLNFDLNDVRLHIITNPLTFTSYVRGMGIWVGNMSTAIDLMMPHVSIMACDQEAPVEFGKQTKEAGMLAIESLERAAAGLNDGSIDAVVTMPVSKSSLHLAGFHFPGQTEFFASRSSAKGDPLMMLCHENVRVALLTIHTALHNVPQYVRRHRVFDHIQAFHHSLEQDFGIAHPRIAVLGLNPHAGENGHIGDEEKQHIEPAIQSANAHGMSAFGPFAADGFFAHGAYKNYDGVLAMYHDQGLIPLKLLAGGAGVNFTAGIPIVRTSPDHGTAFDIAGNYSADHSSALNALRMAIEIVRNRKNASR